MCLIHMRVDFQNQFSFIKKKDASVLRWYYRSRIARALNSRRGELSLRSVFLANLKAIYLANPKVAGSTIIATLIRADAPAEALVPEDHNTNEARRAISSEKDPAGFWSALHDPTFFRFAFVRHPYTRIVSCYRDKILSGREPRFRRLLNLPESGNIKLEEFLRCIADQEPARMNRHWRPQHELISRKVNLNFLGRFERFQKDFMEVLERLNVSHSLVNAQRSHATDTGYQVEIASENKKMIQRIYRNDFERFGYEF